MSIIKHIGHSFGPRSPVIKRKLKEIDESIRYFSDYLVSQNNVILTKSNIYFGPILNFPISS